jgi:hypothetical protein
LNLTVSSRAQVLLSYLEMQHSDALLRVIRMASCFPVPPAGITNDTKPSMRVRFVSANQVILKGSRDRC